MGRLLVLHAEAVHGCEHTAIVREGIGMAGPRGEQRAIPLDVKRLARAIADHGDICSRMAIPECADAIAAAYSKEDA